MPVVAIVFAIVLVLVFWAVRWRLKKAERAEFIRHYPLPPGLFERLRKKHPQLTLKDCQLIAQGLRQFFLAYLHSGRQFVAMPSQGADDLWHEFILYTKNYDRFCRQAFGRFLHHTPAIVLGADRKDNSGLRRVWWYACREENIDPRQPTRLPLLFALDAKLGIAGGFVYSPDCQALQGKGTAAAGPHCAADFADSSIDGGSDGFGDSSADSGSDSGGGCGGGCGGGD